MTSRDFSEFPPAVDDVSGFVALLSFGCTSCDFDFAALRASYKLKELT